MPAKKKKAAMPQKDHDPLVQIDDAYVQALKIRSLEERNEELRCEAERLRALSGEMSHDRQDVFEHLERDNQAKAVALHDLTGQITQLRQELKDEKTGRADELRDIRATAVAARQQYETETAELKQQLSELTAVKHTKERMERQISELLLEVQELKERHGAEMGELKRDFDLKVAALHTETQLKLEQTEASVEARAMTRVDEVTKSTLIVNSRRLWEIENIHREMSEVRRDHDRMEKEYKAMKFEVELKRVELRKFTDKIMLLKQTIAQQDQTIKEHKALEASWKSISDRGDKETVMLQRMVRALEDRVSQQARQIQHYQSRVLNLEHNRRDVYSAPQAFPLIHKPAPKDAGPRDKPQASFLNFVMPPPAGARRSSGQAPRRQMRERSGIDRVAVDGKGGWPVESAPRSAGSRREDLVSKSEVEALLIAASAGAATDYTEICHSSGAVTHR